MNGSQLSSRTALIANSLFIRDPLPIHSLSSSLIHVTTSVITIALRHILPHLQLGIPVLLTSPPSSGKTHILDYLSSQIYPAHQPRNRILTIPLADTTIDVKSLLGTYVSSPAKPGSFEYKEGALARGIRAGYWVIFEDVDRASMEMLVTIAGLTRSLKPGRAGRRAKLAVPGRDPIEAGHGFAIFAFRTTQQGAHTPPTFFGFHNFTEIHFDAPSDADVLAILSARFDKLPPALTEIMVEIWQEVRFFARTRGQAKGREIGLRDLQKWCARTQRNLPPVASLVALEQSGALPFVNPVFQDEILLEAADTFLAAFDTKIDSQTRRKAMVCIIADKIGMDEERAIAVLDTRKPQFEVSSLAKRLHIGRIALPLSTSPRRSFHSHPFALSKPSLVLLERVAAAIRMGEPLLLVGETGTGKTTAVQHIAKACRSPLSVLNLSTQTESSDLLGGFKPIDASVSARALHARWQKLFCETFSLSKIQNGAYLETVSKALLSRRWDRCADLWAQSARRAVDKLAKNER